MWCGHCGQDVPALAGAKPGQRRCLRCDRPLTREDESVSRLAEQPPDDAWTDLPLGDPTSPAFDWQTDDILHDLQSSLRRATSPPSWHAHPAHHYKTGYEPPAAHFAPTPAPLNSIPLVTPPVSRGSQPSAWRNLLASLSWFALSIGTTTFACGAALVGFSLYYDRADLWDSGLPIALIGQIALLLGVALRIERLGRANDQAAGELLRVERQLDEYHRHSRPHPTMPAGAHRFYDQLADGASPHILLADLKSQLDALSTHLTHPAGRGE